MNKKNTTIIAVLVVLLVLGFFGWQMWRDNNNSSESPNLFVAEEQANPFEESTNPYQNIKTNPFE